jgi:hypothetical protein
MTEKLSNRDALHALDEHIAQAYNRFDYWINTGDGSAEPGWLIVVG